MSVQMSNLEQESVYDFEEPRPKMSLKMVARGALFIAASATSVSLGYQLGGPALAVILHGSANGVGAVASSTIANSAATAAPTVGMSTETQPLVVGQASSAIGGSKSSVSSGSIDAPNRASVAPTSQTIQVPAIPSTVNFGNVSSATPAAGKVATGGNAAGFHVEDAYESESDDRD